MQVTLERDQNPREEARPTDTGAHLFITTALRRGHALRGGAVSNGPPFYYI